MFHVTKDDEDVGIIYRTVRARREDGYFYYFEMDECPTFLDAIKCARQAYGDVEVKPMW